MAQQRKILVADSSEAIREALRENLKNKFDLRICSDGRTALELMYQFQPDVLVLDLMIPGFDGLSLLQTASDAGLHPAVLATTRQQSDYILDRAYRLGVSYVMLRPCQISALTGRILDLAYPSPDKVTQESLGMQIDRILILLGFPSKGKNYPILRDALLWAADNPGAFLSKELYPVVGKVYGITAGNTEKKIRDFIHTVWRRRDKQIWQFYFPGNGHEDAHCPSNGTFFNRITQCLPTPLERSGSGDV